MGLRADEAKRQGTQIRGVARLSPAFDAVDGAHSAASECHRVVALKRATLRGAVHGRSYHDWSRYSEVGVPGARSRWRRRGSNPQARKPGEDAGVFRRSAPMSYWHRSLSGGASLGPRAAGNRPQCEVDAAELRKGLSEA